MRLGSDDFELFGLPRRFAQDRAEIDARWRDLQAQVHPDRFSAEGAAAQRVAMQWAMRVNEAHQRLKDPVKRAALLCEMAGSPIDAERNTAMPTSFLVEQMAWREALDDAASGAEVEALAERVQAHRRAALATLERTIDTEHDMPAAAAQVRALMFVDRFAADIEGRLEALSS